MTAVIIAIILLIVAVGAVYHLLKNMGENGIEVAAPGSCKSGRCGARHPPASQSSDEDAEVLLDEADDAKRKKCRWR